MSTLGAPEIILILVIVISGTLNIYMLRQWRTASKDLAGIRGGSRRRPE